MRMLTNLAFTLVGSGIDAITSRGAATSGMTGCATRPALVVTAQPAIIAANAKTVAKEATSEARDRKLS